MAVTAQSIIDKAETRLNDTSNVRWSEDDLLSFLNEGQRDIAIRTTTIGIRSAYVAEEVITLSAGTKQTLSGNTTATPIKLLDCVRNVGVSWIDTTVFYKGDIVYDVTNSGAYECILSHTAAGTRPADDSTNWIATSENRMTNIEQMHSDNLDALVYSWRGANQDHTGSDGVLTQYWMEDEKDILIYHVYPQQPDSSYKFNILVSFAALPASVSAIGNNITLADFYQDALMKYIIYAAFGIEDEVDVNGNTASDKWYSIYLNDAIFGLR